MTDISKLAPLNYVALRKVQQLRDEGFTDYETAAVLRKGNVYCIVGAYGDVRWHGESKNVFNPLPVAMMHEVLKGVHKGNVHFTLVSDEIRHQTTMSYSQYPDAHRLTELYTKASPQLELPGV